MAPAWAKTKTHTPAPEPAKPAQIAKPEPVAEPPRPDGEIAEKFLPAYIKERPKSFLIDPQNLLSAADHQDRLLFLNGHASDSAIDLYVYLIAKDQTFPAHASVETLAERHFATGRPAAIVIYPLGAADHATLQLSPSLAAKISPADQHRALESSYIQAATKPIAPEQLEQFCSQMSIRLYWMEQTAFGQPIISDAPPVISPNTEKKAKDAAKEAKFIKIRDQLIQLALPAGLGLGALLFALIFKRWLNFRARYRFPEFQVEPRLDGPHAAGIGAVITFANSAQPPAAQREQVPEYLRRS
jgi:hypothetical protein